MSASLTLPAEGEIGVVDIGPLTLESGAVIDDVCIAVQRWGELSPTRDNVVVVLHALTGDSHITGPAGPGHPTPGWWDGVAGPGAPIDTDRWCAVATNVLGGCRGSTGPSSLARDGKPWGSRFPLITVRDQVNADVAALAALGITEVAARGRRIDGRRTGPGVDDRLPRPGAGRAGAGGRCARHRRPDRHAEHPDRGDQGRPELAGRRLSRHRPQSRCRAGDRPPLRPPDLPRRGRAGHPVRQRRPGRRGPADRRPLRGAELPGAPGRQAGRRGSTRAATWP